MYQLINISHSFKIKSCEFCVMIDNTQLFAGLFPLDLFLLKKM